MQLHQSSWQEIDAYLTKSKGIIVPIGSTEQHGPNGLLGTDAICPEVIAKRLEAYHRSTLPLAEYYQKRGLLHALNADQPIEVLKTQVLQVVEPALRDPALSEP